MPSRTTHSLLLLLFLLLLFHLSQIESKKPRSRCPRITLENGQARLRSRGRIAKFRCNRGFTRYFGDRFATCVRNTWKGLIPKCIRRGCRPVEAPRNGQWTYQMNEAIAKFWCQPGYTLQGSHMIYCNSHYWNDTVPLCAAPQAPATSCDFEEDLQCGWSNTQEDDDFDWQRQRGPSGPMLIGTGPRVDHTLGTSAGHYMLVDASVPRPAGQRGLFFSPVYPPPASPDTPVCFFFFYHMYGSGDGVLNVYLQQEHETVNLLPPIMQMTASPTPEWQERFINVSGVHSNYQIVLESIRKRTNCDIAVDDVQVAQGAEDCGPHSPFLQQPTTTTTTSTTTTTTTTSTTTTPPPTTTTTSTTTTTPTTLTLPDGTGAPYNNSTTIFTPTTSLPYTLPTSFPPTDTTVTTSNITDTIFDTTDTIFDTTDTIFDTNDTISNTNDTISDNTDIISNTTIPISDTISNTTDTISDNTDTLSNNTDIISNTTIPISDTTGTSPNTTVFIVYTTATISNTTVTSFTPADTTVTISNTTTFFTYIDTTVTPADTSPAAPTTTSSLTTVTSPVTSSMPLTTTSPASTHLTLPITWPTSLTNNSTSFATTSALVPPSSTLPQSITNTTVTTVPPIPTSPSTVLPQSTTSNTTTTTTPHHESSSTTHSQQVGLSTATTTYKDWSPQDKTVQYQSPAPVTTTVRLFINATTSTLPETPPTPVAATATSSSTSLATPPLSSIGGVAGTAGDPTSAPGVVSGSSSSWGAVVVGVVVVGCVALVGGLVGAYWWRARQRKNNEDYDVLQLSHDEVQMGDTLTLTYGRGTPV